MGDALDKLATAVDGADAAPSPDAVTGFATIQPALDHDPRRLGRAEGERPPASTGEPGEPEGGVEP